MPPLQAARPGRLRHRPVARRLHRGQEGGGGPDLRRALQSVPPERRLPEELLRLRVPKGQGLLQVVPHAGEIQGHSHPLVYV